MRIVIILFFNYKNMKDFNIWLKDTTKVVSLLQIILASENVANLKNRKYHRNVESKRFRELHSYFEELYTASFERIDEIAERIRSLWSYTKGTFKEYLELSVVKDDEKEQKDASEMIKSLANDKIAILKLLREWIAEAEKINDVWTEDFLTGLVWDYEKDLWMLRSMAD